MIFIESQFHMFVLYYYVSLLYLGETDKILLTYLAYLLPAHDGWRSSGVLSKYSHNVDHHVVHGLT